jgi:hypothetical protein
MSQLSALPNSFGLRRIPVDERDRFVAEAAEHGHCTEIGDFQKGECSV